MGREKTQAQPLCCLCDVYLALKAQIVKENKRMEKCNQTKSGEALLIPHKETSEEGILQRSITQSRESVHHEDTRIFSAYVCKNRASKSTKSYHMVSSEQHWYRLRAYQKPRAQAPHLPYLL